MPHDGWRNFLPYHIRMWKTGSATVEREGLVAWYRLTHSNACPTGQTTGNTASHLQLEYAPGAVSRDRIFFTALLGSYADPPYLRIGDSYIPTDWTTIPHGNVGLYHGSVSTLNATGPVVLQLNRTPTKIARINGNAITNDCPHRLTNWNAWVGSDWGANIAPVSPPLRINQMVCVKGFGANNFDGLCSYTCSYGYCPEAACVCTHFGPQPTVPPVTKPPGYPLPGASPAYIGLCSYACSRDYCPPTACGRVDGGTQDPTHDEFGSPACTGGTGPLPYTGLCSYSCDFG